MPLTPADVRNKQFSTTRLRPGYDEEEVDAFLDEVEAELDRLIQENEELRAKLAECLRGKVPGGMFMPTGTWGCCGCCCCGSGARMGSGCGGCIISGLGCSWTGAEAMGMFMPPGTFPRRHSASLARSSSFSWIRRSSSASTSSRKASTSSSS
jgi:DivIVA domain-containing protein